MPDTVVSNPWEWLFPWHQVVSLLRALISNPRDIPRAFWIDLGCPLVALSSAALSCTFTHSWACLDFSFLYFGPPPGFPSPSVTSLYPIPWVLLFQIFCLTFVGWFLFLGSMYYFSIVANSGGSHHGFIYLKRVPLPYSILLCFL